MKIDAQPIDKYPSLFNQFLVKAIDTRQKIVDSSQDQVIVVIQSHSVNDVTERKVISHDEPQEFYADGLALIGQIDRLLKQFGAPTIESPEGSLARLEELTTVSQEAELFINTIQGNRFLAFDFSQVVHTIKVEQVEKLHFWRSKILFWLR